MKKQFLVQELSQRFPFYKDNAFTYYIDDR